MMLGSAPGNTTSHSRRAREAPTSADRAAALPAWLHAYNNHRTHTALGGHPPASRVPNLPGQYS